MSLVLREKELMKYYCKTCTIIIGIMEQIGTVVDSIPEVLSSSMEMKEKYKSKWLEAFRISILEFQIWVLELCADPCRPRTCADHVFLIYYLINFEIRILRGPFMRRPYVDNQIIQTAISSDLVKVIISILEKD